MFQGDTHQPRFGDSSHVEVFGGIVGVASLKTFLFYSNDYRALFTTAAIDKSKLKLSPIFAYLCYIDISRGLHVTQN